MISKDYIDLGFDEVKTHQGPDKLCRACNGDITKGDRVMLRTTPQENLNGLHHEACANLIIERKHEQHFRS
jgi:hypothetical protein